MAHSSGTPHGISGHLKPRYPRGFPAWQGMRRARWQPCCDSTPGAQHTCSIWPMTFGSTTASAKLSQASRDSDGPCHAAASARRIRTWPPRCRITSACERRDRPREHREGPRTRLNRRRLDDHVGTGRLHRCRRYVSPAAGATVCFCRFGVATSPADLGAYGDQTKRLLSCRLPAHTSWPHPCSAAAEMAAPRPHIAAGRLAERFNPHRGRSRKSKIPRSRRVSPEASTEPPSGFEPETYALRVRCSGQLS